MNIREADIDDLPAIVSIYNAVIRTSPVTFDLVEKTLEERTVWFRQFNERHPLLVAEIEGEVVGFASLSPFRDKPAYNRTVEDSIYLADKARGKGIGSILLEALIERAKQLEHHTIIAVIANDYAPSSRLHKRFGFEKTGCLKEVGYKFDEWHDIHFYQLMLEKS